MAICLKLCKSKKIQISMQIADIRNGTLIALVLITYTKGFDVRVTSSSYYNNIYGENNKLSQQLFDVNKQISSGQKIQYAHEDPKAFIETLRLDDEITTLTQVKSSVQSAYKFTSQSDSTIGDMVTTLDSLKVKLVNAANGSQSDTSRYAIAKEMRGLKNHLMELSNTSIGGEFLFSGSATTQKPIDANGVYQGNDQNIESFLGSGIKQKYNISGAQLFLGENSKINRTVTTNVQQLSLTEQFPDIMQDPNLTRDSGTPTYISGSSTIRDLMGDTDANATNDTWQAHFYVQGTKSDGSSFKKQIDLNTTATVNDLLQNISNAYGPDQVNVSINKNGQIEISDKQSGSSKLDFHMVGAVDFDTTGGDAANVSDPMYGASAGSIDNLQSANATTNFQDVVGPTATPKLLYIKEFTKSGLAPSAITNTIEGINYDRTNFVQEGAKLLSNVPQIDKSTNGYATPSTKLLDVSGAASLNGKQFIMEGNSITGAPIKVQIDLSSAGSTFSLDGGVTNFSIYNTATPRAAVDADKITYQQLMDVVNMAQTNSIPAGGSAADYDAAISASKVLANTSLDQAGKVVFEDKSAPVTKASLSLYDVSSADYTVTSGSALTFNANNALTIRDPKTDFFARIEEAIRSVEEGKTYADGSDTKDPRNAGINNAIQMIDDLSDHTVRMQTEVGSYSKVMQATTQRSELLIVNTKMLRSDVIDTDIAEATLRMQQLSLNYQALLSNISKVSKLSLVNYM